MDKKYVEYLVIILNYNTFDDAIKAAMSVKRNAKKDNYLICVADNASINSYDRDMINNIQLDNVITLQINENNGYAIGNNNAIKYSLEYCNPKYIVIMNPDVEIIEPCTIEKLIDEISNSGESIVGGQPLVWNYHYKKKPEEQLNIRKVPTVVDMYIMSFLPFKLLFRKHNICFNYLDKMPYKNNITYESPSGAFFIINANIFQKIGYFDENTFLYLEEFILGYKISKLGGKMLFVPKCKVKHEHGKSTNLNRYSVSKRSYFERVKSRIYYAKAYLSMNKVQIGILYILSCLDYFIRKMVSFIKHN